MIEELFAGNMSENQSNVVKTKFKLWDFTEIFICYETLSGGHVF